MKSTSTPWFEDSQLSEREGFGTQETRWPRGSKSPGLADVRETTQHLVKVLKPLRLLILAPIFTMLLIGLIPYVLPFETDEALQQYQVFYPLVSLPLWAFFFALAKPARRLVLGESLSVQEATKDTLSVFLQVLVSIIVVTILLLMTLLSCALPFFLALPILLRTPYEASKGLWPLEAISRSSKALFRSTATTMLAAGALANAIIALLLLRFLVATLISVGVPELPLEVADTFFHGAVLLVLWHQSLGSFLTGDAAMSGHLTPDNLARLRTAEKPHRDQFYLGRAFGIVRIITPAIAIATVVALIAFELDSRRVYPTDHLIQPGHAAPEFSLDVLDGPVKTSSDYLGTPTIYYLWAPWCGTCTAQNDIMKDVQTTVGEEVDVVSIAVSFEDLDELRDYVRDHEINYEVLVGDDDISEQFNLNSYPTVVLVDAQGLVHSNWAGSALSEEIHSALEELEK